MEFSNGRGSKRNFSGEYSPGGISFPERGFPADLVESHGALFQAAGHDDGGPEHRGQSGGQRGIRGKLKLAWSTFIGSNDPLEEKVTGEIESLHSKYDGLSKRVGTVETSMQELSNKLDNG